VEDEVIPTPPGSGWRRLSGRGIALLGVDDLYHERYRPQFTSPPGAVE